MTADPAGLTPADEAALRAFAADLEQREELVGLRESMLDAMTDFRQGQSDQMDLQMQDGRDVNAQLVVNALRLQQLQAAAEQNNRRKDEFIAMLSHELRNPLAPMRNVIEMLGSLTGADRRLPWIHEVLDRQVHQLGRLLDDLLDAGRVRSGKVLLHKKPIAVRSFMEQAVETSHPLFEAREQTFTVAWPADALLMLGDAARLTQVFVNLLNNASKYTQIGGAIALNVRRSGNVLVACVADNGRGISAAALASIFELFMQEERSQADAQGGLGIGLAVVRELVHLHGGSVDARSPGLDLGSEFRVRLPLLDELALSLAPQPLPLRVVELPTLAIDDSVHALSIVMIDDNVDANDSLAALLSLAGHHVELAYDGKAGLALVLATRPQVVLCDLGMPGLHGLDVAARLRAEGVKPQPLLVALTGYGQGTDVQRSREAGFDEHLIKPVEPNLLLALLQREAERLSERPPGLPH